MAEETQKSRRVKRGALVAPNLAGTTRFSWFYLLPAAVAAGMGGGGRESLTAAVLLSVGLAIFLDHSVLIPRPALQWTLLGLAGWGLTAFLPQICTLRAPPEWRTALTGDLGVPLPSTAAPQPWMVLEQWLLLLAGCLLAVHLAAHSFSQGARRKLLQGAVALVAGIALASIACYAMGWKMPGWQSATGFGPFPNRNQSGNLFAVPIVVATALAFEAFSARRPRWGAVWTSAAVILLAAVVLTTSRAALGIAFGSILLWSAYTMMVSGMRASKVVVVFSLLLLCAGGVLAFGGKTIERILPKQGIAEAQPNFRPGMAKDVLKMSMASPLLGVGLANFEAVFPFYRVASASEERVLHPDSDWLMTLAEMGWPGLLLAAAALAIALRAVFPLAPGSQRSLRGAAAIAAISFAVHGAFDISGHRPGTVFLGIAFAACALHSGEFRKPLPAIAAKLLRAGGLILALLGGIVAGSAAGLWSLPTRGMLEKLQHESQEALKIGDTPSAIDSASRAIALSPMRWQPYYQRAAAEVLEQKLWDARLDFRRARFLEPFHANVPLSEAAIWWRTLPMASFAAWREALHRTRRKPEDMLGAIFPLTNGDPRWNEQILALSQVRREIWIRAMELLNEEQFATALEEQLAEDPRLAFLTAAERKHLFALWEARLGRSHLVQAIRRQPAWESEGWFWLARDQAQNASPQEAYATALRFVILPATPISILSGTAEEYERRWLLEQDNFDIPLALVRYYREQNRLEEALTVLARVQSLPAPIQAPPYFLYMKAETEAALKRWDEAWKSMETYVRRAGAQ